MHIHVIHLVCVYIYIYIYIRFYALTPSYVFHSTQNRTNAILVRKLRVLFMMHLFSYAFPLSLSLSLSLFLSHCSFTNSSLPPPPSSPSSPPLLCRLHRFLRHPPPSPPLPIPSFPLPESFSQPSSIVFTHTARSDGSSSLVTERNSLLRDER